MTCHPTPLTRDDFKIVKEMINENTTVENSEKSSEFGSRLTETHSFDGRNQDRLTMIDFADNETGPSSSYQKESLIWLEDYKCSLCGAELPPSFLEERQEHFDFHLAEKLQVEEESGHSYKNLPLKNRVRQKEGAISQSKGKKSKHSPSTAKHIPIDAFFTKRSNNL